MTSLPLINQLNALTVQGISFLTTLDHLLEKEFEALNDRDIKALQQLVQDKTETLVQLEENNLARSQLFTQVGITPDKKGLQEFSSQLSATESDNFKKQWAKLEQILLAVNEKNKRNDLIISRNSRNLEQLLSIMRGQNQKNTLYDQSGEKGNYSAQSRIGKA